VRTRLADADHKPGFQGIEGIRELHPGKRLTSVVHGGVAKAALALVIVSGLYAVTAGAAAAADFTWSGGATDLRWSDGSNWAGTAPSGSVGTLTFPLLTSPACALSPTTAACYGGLNDVPGLSANAISIDDTAPYLIIGDGLELGAGGISSAPSGATSGLVLSTIDLPITLTAPQTWTIQGDADASELAIESVGAGAGGPQPLSIALSDDARIGFGVMSTDDSELGAVSASGSGAVVLVGSLNATDGQPLSLANTAGLVVPVAGAQVGPVTATDGYIRVGYGQAPDDGTLAVQGSVTLDSASRAAFFIDQPAEPPSPGTDFTQLTATGDVDLGGATLDLYQGVVGTTATCEALQPGDVYTLIATTGTVTGTFAGVPDGATVQMPTPCSGPSGAMPNATINYTPNSVTATIDPAPTTTLTATPADPVTNQPVTLTATVSAGAATPAGTVTFELGGTPIAGCVGEPVVLSAATYIATCTTTFSAGSSPESLTAVFSPAPGSVLTGSTSSPMLVAVAKAATTTSVTVSSAAPTVGSHVTYTASVAPDSSDAGALPSGTVEFLDHGQVIGNCSSDILNSVASCQVSYSTAGSHTIGAVYLGDANFSGSSSAAQQTVNVTGSTHPGSGSSKALASPVYRRSAAVGAVSGTVLVRAPHSTRFVALRRGGLVPLGSTIDAARGTVELVFARPPGRKLSARSSRRGSHELLAHAAAGTMWAQFWQGEFVIVQTRSGMVIAVLAGGNFAPCKRRPHVVVATVASARPIRKLWARDHGGSFGTKGAYVATAVVGTQWLTEDFCSGSKVLVRQGTVRVTSSVTHRSRLVHANHSYLVKA
jgi:hypothetical protein